MSLSKSNRVESTTGVRVALVPALTIMVLIGGAAFLWYTGMKPVPNAFAGTAHAGAYGGMEGRSYGLNAHGRPINPEQFKGQYLWVEYAAPWCGHYPRQAAETRKTHHAFGSNVAFLTVLTSEQVMQPASVATAERWAKRHKLDDRFVVAGSNTSMTVPQHRLYGPDGELLYTGRGVHASPQIVATIRKHMK